MPQQLCIADYGLQINSSTLQSSFSYATITFAQNEVHIDLKCGNDVLKYQVDNAVGD